MGIRKRILSADELTRPFIAEWAAKFPPILSPAQLAELLGQSRKTVYGWIAQGRLDGSFRKRGQHVLVWRDKALDMIFNGSSWSENCE